MLDQGIEVSYFCYHPGLSVAADCRQCLVGLSNVPKLVPACQTVIGGAGMEVGQLQRQGAATARRQLLEFTLVNHPVDCPICDKAGECTLQRHYMDWDARPLAHRPRQGATSPRRSTWARGSCSTTSAASSAPAACASAPRWPGEPQLVVAQARRPHRADHRPGQAAGQPLLAQHRGHLPGGRADRQGLPLQEPRSGSSRPRRQRLQRLRHRAAAGDPPPGRQRSTAWSPPHATRTSTSTGCATTAATTYKAGRATD